MPKRLERLEGMKQFGLIILLCSTVALAKRPEWYPENGHELEAKCMEENAISEQTMADIRKLHIRDTPEIRSLVLCCLKNTNVCRPGEGPEPDRLAVAFRQSIKLDCDMDMIIGCTEKYVDLEPEDFAYFSVIRCIYDSASEKCVGVVDEDKPEITTENYEV